MIFGMGVVGSYLFIGLIVALLNHFLMGDKFPGVGGGAGPDGVTVLPSVVIGLEATALWPYVVYTWATR